MRFFIFLGALFTPVLLSAHTRWFAEGEIPPLEISEPTSLYMTIWAVVVIAIVAFGIFLHKRNWFQFDFLRPKKKKSYERAASTFAMIAGAFFLIAGTHEYLFSPNLTIESGIPFILIVLQIVIGLAYLLGVGTRLSSLLLIFLWIFAIPYAGLLAMIENIWILSTAIFIAIMGNDYFSIISVSRLKTKFSPLKKYALSILRLGTGATLMILGLSEKIFAPELGVNFLALHDWNFMQALGFNYSDYLFTLSGGTVEFLFGLMFVFGIVPRLNALIVAVVFTTPLFILGPIELAGHLPHFAAVVLLLLFGNGGHFLPFKTKHDKATAPA